jgi:hypothetical protein
MNEIEKTEGEIKVLQAKLELLKEMENFKTPVEEAYKKWMGEYPLVLGVSYFDDNMWSAFQEGYNASKITEAPASMTNCIIKGNPPYGYVTWHDWYDALGSKGILRNLRISAKEYQPKEKEQKWDVVRESVKWCKEHREESVEDYLKPQTPDKIEENLREAFKKVQQTEEWKETQRKIDVPKESWMDKSDEELVAILEKNPPDCLKFVMGKTLEGLIEEWWCDVFTRNSDLSMEESIDCLVSMISNWLPKEQSAAGSQNAYVECSVDGYNDALTKIKSKLRNKK